MGITKISWTNKVWNPITGCSKISEGCRFCYAERMFPRVYGKDTIADGWLKRPFTDVKLHHDRLEQPLHWKKPSMIFVNSMSDLFHEDIPFQFILKVFKIMHRANQHTFQVLTKRIDRAIEFLEWCNDLTHEEKYFNYIPNNVWFGVSVENQKTANERIPILLDIPAKVRWVSIEPMLETIKLTPYFLYCTEHKRETERCMRTRHYGHEYRKLDWVVVGAESKGSYPGRRIFETDIIGIVNQCKSANIPVFVKQIHRNESPIDREEKIILEKNINKFPDYLKYQEYPK